MNDFKERPNRYPLPPILTLGMLALCWLLDRYLPLGWEADQVSTFMRGTGLFLLVCAIALDVWAYTVFRKHNANMLPHKAATDLLMNGPFAHSRNPIYVANVMLTVGFGFLLGSRWYLIGGAVLFFLLGELAIKREEKHMEALFGDRWRDYCKSVRRWV